MCEENETLQRLRYELDLMWGNGVVNIARLKQLAGTDCQEGHHERN
jgi:hypothetical protein